MMRMILTSFPVRVWEPTSQTEGGKTLWSSRPATADDRKRRLAIATQLGVPEDVARMIVRSTESSRRSIQSGAEAQRQRAIRLLMDVDIKERQQLLDSLLTGDL